MIEINLMSAAEGRRVKAVRRKPKLEVAKIIPLGFAGALAVLVLLYSFANLRLSSLSQKLLESGQTLDKLTDAEERAVSIEEELPVLRKRAVVFQMGLEDRKVWSELLRGIALSCPENIRLTKISLTVPRGTALASNQSRELVIEGFYSTEKGAENSEMSFVSNLQKNESVASHYPRVFVATTDPTPGKTDFSIRCTEQY